MNTDDLLRDVLRHGVELRHWPWLRRVAAQRLLARSPQARQMLEDAQASERVLRRAMAPPPLSDALLRRLDAIPRQFPRPSRAQEFAAEWRTLRIGTGWALACGVASLAVGASGWISPGGDAELLAQLALGADLPASFASPGAVE